MKILHTSDWHLGVKTDRRNRIEEQKKIMQEIVRIADKEAVDVVLIAGDVYDQAVCSSEAEDLFYSTIEQLSANNSRVVIAIAGNHDDPKRLVANTHFAKKHNVVLAGSFKLNSDSTTRGNVRISEVGEACIEVKIDNGELEPEKAVFALLPYPTDYRLECPAVGETYSEKVKEWSKIACKGFKKNAFNVLVSHFTLVGGEWEEGDKIRKISINESGVVKKSDLPKADYYALGHLHLPQVVDGANYSGSPIRLSYTQKKCGVNIVTVKGGKLEDVKFVNIRSAVKMCKVCANGIDEVEKELQTYSTEDMVELTICQDKPLTSQDIKNIKEKFACVTQVKLMLTNIQKDDKVFVTNRDKLSATDLFTSFYRSKTGKEPENNLTSLFVELMEEVANETN